MPQPATGRRARRAALFLLILAAQFGIFEAALRVWGSSEAAPAFQGLFEGDPLIGYRLKPYARTRFTTSEFETDIAINGAGLRDNDELGAKRGDELRIVVLGDSLVLSVQVPFEQTFGELLERKLNEMSSARRVRVLNAGVQGYGPVEELLQFRAMLPVLQPDLVITTVFVGNDAEEALGSRAKLTGEAPTAEALRESLTRRLRRLVRRSMVLQILRLRVLAASERFTPTAAPPEPPLQSYAANPAPRIADGLAVARQCVDEIVQLSTRAGARSAIVLMPARFQVDDADYGRLRETVRQSGGELVRDAASRRFDEALAAIQAPRLDLLPALRHALPGPDLFFQETVHLTPRGHEVVADALARFVIGNHLLERAELPAAPSPAVVAPRSPD